MKSSRGVQHFVTFVEVGHILGTGGFHYYTVARTGRNLNTLYYLRKIGRYLSPIVTN